MSYKVILLKVFLVLVGVLLIIFTKKLGDEAIKRRGLHVFLAESWIGALLVLITNGLIKRLTPNITRCIYYLLGLVIILIGLLIQS